MIKPAAATFLGRGLSHLPIRTTSSKANALAPVFTMELSVLCWAPVTSPVGSELEKAKNTKAPKIRTIPSTTTVMTPTGLEGQLGRPYTTPMAPFRGLRAYLAITVANARDSTIRTLRIFSLSVSSAFICDLVGIATPLMKWCFGVFCAKTR